MSEFHFRKRSMEITVDGKQYTFKPIAPERLRELNRCLQEKIKAKASMAERLEVYINIIDTALGEGTSDKILAERGSVAEICQDADDLLVYLMACQTECAPTRRPAPVWTGEKRPPEK